MVVAIRVTIICEACAERGVHSAWKVEGFWSPGDRVRIICPTCETPITAVVPDAVPFEEK